MVYHCNYLQVDSEEPVYEAVIKWVCHRLEERRVFFATLLEHVRLPLLSPQYITDVLDQEPLIRTSFVCRDLLDEAKRLINYLRNDRSESRKSVNAIDVSIMIALIV